MTRPILPPIVPYSSGVLLCALVLSMSTLAYAQTSTINQTLSVPKVIHPGTPVTMLLDVTHPPGTRLEGPQAPESIRWKILETTPAITKDKNQTRTILTVKLAAWRPTTVRVPAMNVQVMGSDPKPLAVLTTTAFSFTATSVLPTSDAALKTPHAPVSIFVQDLGLLWAGLIAAGVLLGGGALMWAARRRRARPAADAPPRDPREVALERLTALSEGQDMEQEQFLSFYTEMSEAVRVYLGHKFSFPGTELTTSEIGPLLRAQQWPKSLGQEDVVEWMHHTDRFKYTEAIPSVDDAQTALRTAFSIVELTHHHQEILAQQRAAQAPTVVLPSATPVVDTANSAEPAPIEDQTDKASQDPEPTPQASAQGFAAWEAIAQDAQDEDDALSLTKEDTMVSGTTQTQDTMVSGTTQTQDTMAPDTKSNTDLTEQEAHND